MQNKSFLLRIKSNLINTLCIQLVLFLFFFNIPLHFFKIPFSSGKLISIAAIIYLITILLVKKADVIKLSKEYLYYIYGVILVYFVTYVLLKIIYNTQDDYYLTVLVFYVIEYLLGAYFIIVLFKMYSFNELIKNIIIISIIQAFIMVGSLFIPALKSFVVAVMEANPQFALFSKADTIKDSFRGLTLASDRTLGMSVFFSFTIMLIFLYIINERSKVKYIKYVLFFLLVFCGGVLAARTFFVGLTFGLIFFFVLINRYPEDSVRLKKYSKYVVSIMLMIFFSIPIIINLFFSGIKDEIDLAFDWAFEIFINLGNDGSAKSESLDDLLNNHLSVIPSDWQTILIGDPNRTFVNGIHYMGAFTDSGYLRNLYVYGIIGSVAVYIFWIFVFYRTARLFNKSEGISYLLFFIGITLFVVQIKYDVFPGSALNFKLVMILFVFGVERKRKQQLNFKLIDEK